MRTRLFVPWTGICQWEYMLFILIMVIVEYILFQEIRLFTFLILRTKKDIV